MKHVNCGKRIKEKEILCKQSPKKIRTNDLLQSGANALPLIYYAIQFHKIPDIKV